MKARLMGQKRGTPGLTRINIWVDMALAALLAGAGASAYLDHTAHLVLGSATLVAVAVHLALHRRWIAATAGRLLQLTWAVRRKTILGLLLLFSFVPLVLSGVVTALVYAPRVSAFHTNAFYLFAGLVLAHLALSWRWIAARLGRREACA